MAILEVNDITSGYEGVQILWGVNLKLEPGKLTTLVGSNGVGKTTLLKTVMGLMRPLAGSVSFQGKDVTEPVRPCPGQGRHGLGPRRPPAVHRNDHLREPGNGGLLTPGPGHV